MTFIIYNNADLCLVTTKKQEKKFLHKMKKNKTSMESFTRDEISEKDFCCLQINRTSGYSFVK